MKIKLHKLLFLSALAFISMQGISAQNYFGIPFGGTAKTIGNVVGVGDKLELENFDSLAGNVDGANYIGDSVNPIDPTLGESATYYDSTPSTSGPSTYRPGASVDIADEPASSGRIITDNQGQEFQMFTVNVLQSGTYTATVNYRHNGANKNFQAYIYPTDLSSSTVIINANASNPVLARTDGSGTAIFMNSPATTPFNLTAGTWIIRTRILSATWDIDYITFTLQTALSTEDVKLEDNTLKAYPNPANNGKFNLNIDSEWNVYSLSGAKVLEGNGKNVDLSSFAKGMYILKTDKESIKLLSKQ